MKKILIFSALMWSAFLMFSCSFSEKPREIIVNNQFSISLPSYLKETSDLNEDASLQYQNLLRDVYVMVIEDDKKQVNDLESEEQPTGIEGFLQLIAGEEGEELFLNKTDLDDLQDVYINGLKAKVFETTKKVNNIDIYFLSAYVESQNTYYQVMAWTSAKKKNKYKETFHQIINSFKEIEQADSSSDQEGEIID